MALSAGDRLGPYEILEPLGAGGMGEVYRARDTKLNRDAAIKVLPAAFAEDADGVARLRREAQVLASLSHPHIASIYGLEETEGALALALELVEGEDLAQRLERGAIPVGEAIALANQVVDGLEAAHEKGVVHRDLKPANMKLTEDGTVKILDFGLAKEYEGEAALGSSDPSQSPTVARFGTEAGVLLGTAAYMSPEQARGKRVDKRTDIWAFGVVLFEMLTGRKLFSGETLSDTLAAVLTREPDWALLPSSTPRDVRRLLARCLERDPRKRLRDIGDARLELGEGRDLTPGEPTPSRSSWRVLPWAVAALALLLAGWTLLRQAAPAGTAREVTHFEIGFPPNVEPVLQTAGAMGISPDGRSVLMVGWRDGVRRMLVRRLEEAEGREVPGGSGAINGAFSPDSGSLAIVRVNGEITRFSLVDQQREVVATGADLVGGVAWTPSGIVFSRGGALWIVQSEGGRPRSLTTLDAERRELGHGLVAGLPDGRFVLFTSTTGEEGGQRVEAVPVEGGPRSVVVERAASPVWSPTGHLLFERDGAILAVAFDPVTATVQGEATPVIEAGAVRRVANSGLGLAISSTGTLLYAPEAFQHKRVVSAARDGSARDLDLPSSFYENPRVSPDGRRLLAVVDSSFLETLDLGRGTRARLAAEAPGTTFATWNLDGTRVVFRRFLETFWAAADGSGEVGPVAAATVNDFPSSAGPDPDSLLLVRVQPETSGDVVLMSLRGAFEPKTLVQTPAYDGGPQLSPDGRWLLHQSNVSGRHEIYVRRYQELDRQWQVSAGGGVQGRWSRDGREIYYRNGRDFLVVSFEGAGQAPTLGRPDVLFADDYELGGGISIPNYDVTPDGRFILLRRAPNGGRLRVVVNWTEELKGILAAGGVR